MREPGIIGFIARLGRRLDLLLLRWMLPFAFLEINIIAAVAALFWLISGKRAPLEMALYAAAAVCFVSLIIWLFRRGSQHDAAVFGDQFFNLKDALVSELEFTGDDAFHQLRRVQTVERCAGLRLADVKLKSSMSVWLLAGLLTVLNVWLYSRDDAPEVKQRRSQAELIGQRSDAANKKLVKELKRLEQSLSIPQKKTLEKAGVNQALKKLKAQKDLKKSLLQYAELEKRLQELQDQIKPEPGLEKLLKQLARELKRAAEMRKLGEMLARGQYAQSAAELRNMKLGRASGKSLQDKLNKLQALSRAAKRTPDNKSDLLKKLQDMSKALSELEKELSDTKNSDLSNCKSGEQIDGELDKLAQMMQSQAAVNEFMTKLAAMRQAAADAQASMLGKQSGSKGQGPGGGKKGEGAGAATAGNMDRKDKSPDSGLLTKITGRKNAGPGASKTLDASSGQAEMRRGLNGSDRAFKYQLEEFFVRDDVPADMKKGVKKYFTDLHK